MTPADIDRVFGHGRLRMATGAHVEVFREATPPGERRRYTKRFLATEVGDFRHWTEREWRILARLFGHGVAAVPEVVRFERGSAEQPALVQTYDAGITLDHWTTLLPVRRSDGAPALRHLFEDCAHWWALAHHCLVALDAIHALQLVHLDLKADNLCLPFGPADFDPYAAGQRLRPRFEKLALIDFAFSLVSGEPLDRALPIARQQDFDYQSPRLLDALEAGARGDLLPTRQLDWRCDLYSLAAMLRRCLPDPEHDPRDGWTALRQTQARALVRRLLEAHEDAARATRPHAALLVLTACVLNDATLEQSLAQGWALAGERKRARVGSPTPVTRIAPALASVAAVEGARSAGFALPHSVEDEALARLAVRRQSRQRAHRWGAVAASLVAVAVAAPLAYRGRQAPSPERPVAAAAATDVAATAPAAQIVTDAAAAQPRNATQPAIDAETAGALGPTAAAASAASAAAADPPVAVVRQAPAPAPEERSAIVDALPAPAPSRSARPPIAVAAPDLPVTSPPPRTVVTAPAATPSERRGAAPAAASRGAAPPAAPRTARATRVAEPLTVKVATAAARPPVPAPRALSERQRALAWLTLRGPSPRGSVVLPVTRAMPTAAPSLAASAPVPTPAPTLRLAAPPAAPVRPAERAGAAPRVASAPTEPVRAAPIEPAPADFAARAEQLLAVELPPLAQRLERRIQHVMSLAAAAAFAGQDDEVRRAADALDDPGAERLAAGASARDDAQALHEAARQALRRRGDPREAHSLQLQAFGADPLDGDVAATLAFLALKQGPARVESARQLALYSLTLPGERSPATRLSDWTTLAIASALTGRERDARRAWYVSLALAPQPERQCRAAINAYALRGEALRLSVEAMLYRAYESGRAHGSALCEWPPSWLASGR